MSGQGEESTKADPVIVVTPNTPTSPKDDIIQLYDDELPLADKKKARRRTRRASRSRSGDNGSSEDTMSESSTTLHTSASVDSLSDEAVNLPPKATGEKHKRHNSSDRGSGRRANIAVTGDSASSKRESSKDKGDKEKPDRSSGADSSSRERRPHELGKDLQLDLSSHLAEGGKDSTRGSSRSSESLGSVPSDSLVAAAGPGSTSAPSTGSHRRKSSTDKTEPPGSAKTKFEGTPVKIRPPCYFISPSSCATEVFS